MHRYSDHNQITNRVILEILVSIGFLESSDVTINGRSRKLKKSGMRKMFDFVIQEYRKNEENNSEDGDNQ